MAKLADIDFEIRIILKFGAVLASVALLVFIGLRGWVIAQDVFFPEPPALPDEKFGKLPDLPEGTVQEKLDYRINTVSGSLPTFGNIDRIKTYKVVREEPSLVALGNVRELLANLGYSQNEAKVGESVYRWTNLTGENIEYNLVTNNFKITSNFLTNPPPLTLTGKASTKEGAYNTVINFLTSLEENTDDIDPENYKASYIQIQNGQAIVVERLEDAQFIRIDLYQKNINENYKIYYPQANSSSMYFILRGDEEPPRVVYANYDHLVIDTNEVATYPFKGAELAFEDLQKGNAVISNQNPNPVIDITEVTIGYFLGTENQEYAIPIVVFIGTNFTGYVRAVP